MEWEETKFVGVHEPTAAAGRGRGELEAEVLSALQQAAPEALTPGEVLERVDGRLAYTTVVTALSRMHAKGLLAREKRGRAFAYTAVSDESELAARTMRRVLDGGTDRAAVLTHFVDELSDADEEFLRRLLDTGR
ncbi:BlaI/MecI/CopY family transcriptional regulator [Streptomyces kaniharaensis]|uniref:BlaI/MecI/CopY family transcriptional regulator n=1 Tax=Streptomyces kaniharaensis TaxID=212423 RepID=A0A6N7KXI8_9ACTN|nr:BlaI/MecI/CopY family transcriptional regulator [Streptomyces kaniharaensis]MQS15505.1 BlaI/MecI/CopY family transcriptional regulator [Streptomyces kaniharaensis]